MGFLVLMYFMTNPDNTTRTKPVVVGFVFFVYFSVCNPINVCFLELDSGILK